jgi:hypothetical protein
MPPASGRRARRCDAEPEPEPEGRADFAREGAMVCGVWSVECGVGSAECCLVFVVR